MKRFMVKFGIVFMIWSIFVFTYQFVVTKNLFVLYLNIYASLFLIIYWNVLEDMKGKKK